MKRGMSNDTIPEQALFMEISALIEHAKATVAAQANHTATMLYWEIGRIINTAVLQEKRAEYGKRIVSSLATQFSRVGDRPASPPKKNWTKNSCLYGRSAGAFGAAATSSAVLSGA